MNDVALVLREVSYEQRSFWRNPAAAIFTCAFPVLFLVIFASLNRTDTISTPAGEIPYNQYFVPAIATFGLISACYTNLAIALSLRRDTGILKRLRGTPVPAWVLLGGMVGNCVVISALLVTLTTVMGVVAYDVQFPGHWLAVVVTLVIGAACFCVLGILVQTFVPNFDAAPAVVNMLLFPVIFISGTFFPVEDGVMYEISRYFPIRHFIHALFRGFDPRISGSAVSGSDLLVMGIWTVGAGLLAVRRFRWEASR